MLTPLHGQRGRQDGGERRDLGREDTSMNSTHRKTVARAVSDRTGETYQQALARVVDIAQDRRLNLDATGRQQLVDLLVERHGAPDAAPTLTPADENSATSDASSPAELITVDLITALNHIGSLIACGLQLPEALRAVAPCSQDAALAASLLGAADAVQGGATLDEAFATQPGLNHPVLCAYAGAGWRAGVMTDSLTRAAKVFENDLRLASLR